MGPILITGGGRGESEFSKISVVNKGNKRNFVQVLGHFRAIFDK